MGVCSVSLRPEEGGIAGGGAFHFARVRLRPEEGGMGGRVTEPVAVTCGGQRALGVEQAFGFQQALLPGAGGMHLRPASGPGWHIAGAEGGGAVPSACRDCSPPAATRAEDARGEPERDRRVPPE
jgi:hypothetical protein